MKTLSNGIASIIVGVLIALIAACKSDSQISAALSPASNAIAVVKSNGIEIAVTEKGFAPADLRVKSGEPVKLRVTRRTDRTCATDIVIKDFGVSKALPLNKTVEVQFTPTKPGKFRYTCAMNMIAGVITVE